MAAQDTPTPPNDMERSSRWAGLVAYALIFALAALALVPILAATPFAAWIQWN